MGAWDRVRGLFTKAAPALNAPPVIGPLPLSYQLNRIGGGLTPAAVSSIIREADAGQMWRLMDLANEARQKDCHLHSVLHTRETALQGLEWRVVAAKKPGREEATKRDRDVADFCTEALVQATGRDGNLEARGFHDLIAHLTGAAYYGYGVAEILWQRSAGALVPEAFVLHAPRRFSYLQDTGRFVWWDLAGGGASQPIDFMARYPGLFIVHQPRIVGDVPCREGLVRPLMWTALFRNWDQRDWLSLAELAWKPWRMGKYMPSASKEDIANLVAILEAQTSSGIAVYKNTTEVAVEWPKAVGQSAHEALALFLGGEMSKAVLGQTLTTEVGKAGGNRALGEVHDGVRKDVREGDARSVATAIRRHLIAPMVRQNYGDTVAIPGFEFVTEEAADLGAFSAAVKTFVDAGVRVPTAWIYDEAGIPAPEDDDEVVGGAPEPDPEAVDVDTSELADDPAEEVA